MFFLSSYIFIDEVVDIDVRRRDNSSNHPGFILDKRTEFRHPPNHPFGREVGLLVDDSVVPKLDIGERLGSGPIGISIGVTYRVPTP